MPAQKKVQKETPKVENKPKTFSALVVGVTDRNELQVQGKEKTERVTGKEEDVCKELEGREGRVCLGNLLVRLPVARDRARLSGMPTTRDVANWAG